MAEGIFSRNRRGSAHIEVQDGSRTITVFVDPNSAVIEDLTSGQRVRFELTYVNGQAVATDIMPLGSDGNQLLPRRSERGTPRKGWEVTEGYLNEKPLFKYHDPSFSGARARGFARPYEVAAFGEADGVQYVVTVPPTELERRQLIDTSEQPTLDRQRVDSYLATSSTDVAFRVFAALDSLSSYIGYSEVDQEDIEIGSFFRRASAKLADGITSEAVQQRLQMVEHAVQLQFMEKRQVEVDQGAAKALKDVIESLKDVPEAFIRIPGMIIIKYLGPQGAVIVTRTLSLIEIRALDMYPAIQTDPRQAVSALAIAVASITTPAPANLPHQGS